MKKVYITTPIYYINADPHIGHAHTSIMGDILKRFLKMRGIDVFYTTGVDEHGQKNQASTLMSGLPQAEYLDQQSTIYRSLFEKLNISFDFFVRTSHIGHKDYVKQVLNELFRKKLIYKKYYEGLYCLGCEQFKKPSDLDKNGLCTDHKKIPELQKEMNYFLKISEYQSWLTNYIEENKYFIQPPVFKKEVLAMLEDPLEDLCISRPKSRVTLGIDFPFDDDFVTYVWFDALLNYISNLKLNFKEESEFNEYWSNSIHLLAKDIIKTHCIYWPILLKLLDIDPPKSFQIHGFWVGEGGIKMSKSLGNIIDPKKLQQEIGTDAMRYYLCSKMTYKDSQISISLIKSNYEADLANNIGNLLYRACKFTFKNFNGKIPKPGKFDQREKDIHLFLSNHIKLDFKQLSLKVAHDITKRIIIIGNRLNKYFNDVTPWELVKDRDRIEELKAILYTVLDGIKILFELAYPIMPNIANEVLKIIGASKIPDKIINYEIKVGKLKPDSKMLKPKIIFPKLN
ncbi:MAG: methionine--tRNA ligase [Promethearchaeota archaeon]